MHFRFNLPEVFPGEGPTGDSSGGTTRMDATMPSTIHTVAFEEGRRLASDPNICAVGYGTKLRGGAPAALGSLIYYVREKIGSREELEARGTWIVPESVEGFGTDVVPMGRIVRATADRAVPTGRRGTRVAAPLIGGPATTALGASVGGPGGYGTVGGLCFDNTTNNVSNLPLLLSNAHVWGLAASTEVIQPVTASAIFGAGVSPAAAGGPLQLVQTRLLPALTAPIAFANAVAQTYLITGGESDPLSDGQAATTVPATTRTDGEQVTITAPGAGLAPAGRRLSPAVSWTYQRRSTTAVLQTASSGSRTVTKLLAARRLFTNAASYTSGQTVSLYAELIPAAGGAPALTSAHLPLVYLYPLPAGDRIIPRVLRPTARQTPTTVTAQFTGFPAPARAGIATLPFTVAGSFTVDSDGTGTFQAANVGTLPAGTLALALPSTAVRLFVPPSTQVIIDIDRRAASSFAAQAVNSAGDSVGTVSIPAPGSNGRTLVTVAASEIVEIRLTGSASAVLYGVTSNRASPETSPPLSYAGNVPVSSLATGKWAASLFVQAMDSGFPESANVVETANGQAALIADCQFTVA